MIASLSEGQVLLRPRSPAELLDRAVHMMVRAGLPLVIVMAVLDFGPTIATETLELALPRFAYYALLVSQIFFTAIEHAAVITLLLSSRERPIGTRAALAAGLRYAPRMLALFVPFVFTTLAGLVVVAIPVAFWFLVGRYDTNVLLRGVVGGICFIPGISAFAALTVWLSNAFYVAATILVTTNTCSRAARRLMMRRCLAPGERWRSLLVGVFGFAPIVVAFALYLLLSLPHNVVSDWLSLTIFAALLAIALVFAISLGVAYEEDLRSRAPSTSGRSLDKFL